MRTLYALLAVLTLVGFGGSIWMLGGLFGFWAESEHAFHLVTLGILAVWLRRELDVVSLKRQLSVVVGALEDRERQAR